MHTKFLWTLCVFCIEALKYLLWLPVYKQTYEQRTRKLV